MLDVPPCHARSLLHNLHFTRVANFVENSPNVGTNSHPWCTRGNRVLVANVDATLTIGDAPLALKKATVTFNVTVTLFKVSTAPYGNVVFTLYGSGFDTKSFTFGSHFYDITSPHEIRTKKTILRKSVYRTNIRLFGYSFDPWYKFTYTNTCAHSQLHITSNTAVPTTSEVKRRTNQVQLFTTCVAPFSQR